MSIVYPQCLQSFLTSKIIRMQGSDRPWKTWKMKSLREISGKIRETQGIYFQIVDSSGKLREFDFSGSLQQNSLYLRVLTT